MKSKTMAIMFLTLVAASPAAVAQLQINKYTQVLQYTLEVVNSKRILYGIVDHSKYNDAAKAAVRQVVANMDISELAVKMTPGYEAQVTTQQISECMRFINSPVGQKLIAAVHNGTFLRDPQSYINAMSPHDGAQFNTFMSGPCLFTNLPDTKQMHAAFYDYLDQQACSTFATKKPNIYADMRHAGYCKE